MSPVIVFGPTGGVGSHVALTAAEHGAEVVLAMRNPSKPIPGLTKEKEAAAKYSRVQADLMDPASLSSAVRSTGAKRAFIYLAHGSQDHMKAAIEALKAAGVEFIVFLSSFTIADMPLSDIPPTELIPFFHAQVEANLDAIYGSDNYVALRPGAFATNLLRWREGIVAGEVALFGGGFEQDNITPGDMGRVGGTILVNGPKNGQKKVYLYGPGVMSQRDAITEMGRLLGREIKITSVTAEEETKHYVSLGTPPFLAEYLVNVFGNAGAAKGNPTKLVRYDEGVENVKLYTGRESTSFKDWVLSIKDLLST